MDEIKLIYFEGCPNAEKVRKNLKLAGCSFEEIKQDDLPPDHLFKKYSSPTILKNGKLIFGSETASQEGCCSLEVPSIQQIREQLGQ